MSTAKMKTPLFDARLNEAREYWLGRLAPGVGAPALSPDFERRADAHGAPAQALAADVPEALAAKLGKITGGSDFLLYATLLAALNVCLHRYAGGVGSVVVGSPARRKDGEGEPPANALPLPTAVDPRATFRQLLMDVRQHLIEAYAQQHYPFERLLRDLRLPRGGHKCPLFDVALVLTNIHGALPDVGHDLTLSFTKTGAHVAGRAEYRGDLFTEETVRRLVANLFTVLEHALENVSTPVGELPAVAPAERELLLRRWNDTAKPNAPAACLHELFEAQAARTPDAPALGWAGGQMTYAELDARANRFAHYLRRRGVRPEARVALSSPRSPELIVALLGVWKAGAAYVPLDPTYPSARLSFMLEDARPRLLV
ncbi:MAG TPA: AMP-binding protein, partial [Pyrinomonadaceae bacterium]